MGFDSATCALVGQQIGKKDVAKAKLFYNSSSIAIGVVLVLVAVLIGTFKTELVGLITQDKKLLELCSPIIWLIALNTLPDGFKGMQKGVIRALGI